MAEKVIIGEWHDTHYTGEVWKRCSECECETRHWKNVIRPAFVRVMCQQCLNAFLDVEEVMKHQDPKALNDWWTIQAII